MDIYERKSRWKWYLGIAGVLVIIITMLYTNNLAKKLGEGETMKVELWINATKSLAEALSGGEDIEIAFGEDVTQTHQVTQIIDDIPLILVGDNGKVEDARNYPHALDSDGIPIQEELDKLATEVEELKSLGRELVLETSDFTQYVYYGHSRTYTLLKYFPLLQFLLIAAFIAFGYFTFSSSRKSEQNQVWVGMAKETAHQLGTPITAIIGWVDHIKEMYGQDEYLVDVVGELQKDAGRLELIADRFSKIGSEPKLGKANIYKELDEMKNYMQRRAARKIVFDFPDPSVKALDVNINPPLFTWVLENLLRNALDAMGGQGKIWAKVYEEKNFVCIDISDTGKGIPPAKFKTIFKPGYSTKKRGWGLGLSLAKRIIETYHSGKIFVSKSIPNEQTTFTIKLPVNHYVSGATDISSPA